MKRLRLALAGALLAAGIAAATIAGNAADAATPVVAGWNNVPYLGATLPPNEALGSIAGQYDAVYRWNTTSGKYDVYAPGAPAYVNTLSQINQGDAIWVNVTGQGGTLPGLTGGSGAVTGSGKYSIAASTFVPASDLAVYEKSFNQINPVGTDQASQRYFAPVHLPDGVTITSMTAAYEASGGEVQVRLDFTPIINGDNPASIYKLAEVLSTGGSSPQTVTAFTHTVDNGANVYFVVVDLTGGSGTKLRGVTIAYAG
ncbi:MAG: hypothetical protein IT304_05545 [Dehalococcoidia bacterium]|nr:hypothetical protein [Dehalococcoidia bacterium]